MTQPPQVCPKCRGAMVLGFVPDFTLGQINVSTWVEGPPEKSFWVGTKIPQEKCITIGTFRCSSCGYLESYASNEFGRK